MLENAMLLGRFLFRSVWVLCAESGPTVFGSAGPRFKTHLSMILGLEIWTLLPLSSLFREGSLSLWGSAYINFRPF